MSEKAFVHLHPRDHCGELVADTSGLLSRPDAQAASLVDQGAVFLPHSEDLLDSVERIGGAVVCTTLPDASQGKIPDSVWKIGDTGDSVCAIHGRGM